MKVRRTPTFARTAVQTGGRNLTAVTSWGRGLQLAIPRLPQTGQESPAPSREVEQGLAFPRPIDGKGASGGCSRGWAASRKWDTATQGGLESGLESWLPPRLSRVATVTGEMEGPGLGSQVSAAGAGCPGSLERGGGCRKTRAWVAVAPGGASSGGGAWAGYGEAWKHRE